MSKVKIFIIKIDIFNIAEPIRSNIGNTSIKKNEILIIKFSLKIFKMWFFIF